VHKEKGKGSDFSDLKRGGQRKARTSALWGERRFRKRLLASVDQGVEFRGDPVYGTTGKKGKLLPGALKGLTVEPIELRTGYLGYWEVSTGSTFPKGDPGSTNRRRTIMAAVG